MRSTAVGELLDIPNVGAKAMRHAAGVLDLELGEVEFRLAAAEESDAKPGARETDRQPFPDSPPRAGDQRGHMLVRVQMRILPPGHS